MTRVHLVVEGQTEQAVVERVLAPALGEKRIYLSAMLVGAPGHKGGVRRFAEVRKDIQRLLRQEKHTYVGTFFDYYGLPIRDWPGRASATRSDLETETCRVEQAMLEDVVSNMGADFCPDRFIPYIQMYELESLFFVDPDVMAREFDRPDLADAFRNIVMQCGGCEKINDSPETAPSKRIIRLHPAYKKGRSLNAHAPIILSRIGIDRVRRSCPHFGAWLSKLEALEK